MDIHLIKVYRIFGPNNNIHSSQQPIEASLRHILGQHLKLKNFEITASFMTTVQQIKSKEISSNRQSQGN